MENRLICGGILFAGIFLPQTVPGQASKTTKPTTVTVATTEPGRASLADLFKMADVVAVVRIVSGDTENYKTPVYKAIVVTGFKGAARGQILYFGPFIGQKLGWEYVVFLRNAKEAATPTTSPNAAYGTVRYLAVFNEGYSKMENSYACVFDEGDPEKKCDYGVRVCTDYIVLPKEVRAFPPEENDPPFGCRWVRKSKFISILDELAEQPGIVQMPESAR
jgi:hypothetical protein